jgi:hypothetical protein
MCAVAPLHAAACCLLLATAWDLLGAATSRDCQYRASQLVTMGLPAAVAFCARAGLHPDLVARLGLVLLGAGPPSEAWEAWGFDAEHNPNTWEVWLESIKEEGEDDDVDREALPIPQAASRGELILPALANATLVSQCNPCFCRAGTFVGGTGTVWLAW